MTGAHGTGPAEGGASESLHPTARSAGAAQLILARHGETDHNRERRMQGQIDIPLNARGAQQAAALARSLVGTGVDAIYASPLARARDTAQVVAEELGLSVRTDPALLERSFGAWEGLTGDEIKERWPREHEAWTRRRHVEGIGAESREQVAARVGEYCRALVREHEGQTILVVAHGAAITLGISALLGVDADAFRGIAGLENCHRSVLEPLRADPQGRLMRLVSHNLPPDFS